MIRWEAKIKLCFLFHFSFSVGSEPQHVFNRVARSVERILHLPCNIFFLHSSFASAFDGLSTPQAQTQERRFIFDHYISWFNTRDTYFPLSLPANASIATLRHTNYISFRVSLSSTFPRLPFSGRWWCATTLFQSELFIILFVYFVCALRCAGAYHGFDGIMWGERSNKITKTKNANECSGLISKEYIASLINWRKFMPSTGTSAGPWWVRLAKK